MQISRGRQLPVVQVSGRGIDPTLRLPLRIRRGRLSDLGQDEETKAATGTSVVRTLARGSA